MCWKRIRFDEFSTMIAHDYLVLKLVFFPANGTKHHYAIFAGSNANLHATDCLEMLDCHKQICCRALIAQCCMQPFVYANMVFHVWKILIADETKMTFSQWFRHFDICWYTQWSKLRHAVFPLQWLNSNLQNIGLNLKHCHMIYWRT